MSKVKALVAAAVIAASATTVGSASAATYSFSGVTFTKSLATASKLLVTASTDTLGLESFLKSLVDTNSVASFLSGIGIAFNKGTAYTLASVPTISITGTDKKQDVVTLTAYSAKLVYTPVKGSNPASAVNFYYAVPGPVAGAGLPVLVGLAGLAGFAALRRKSSKTA